MFEVLVSLCLAHDHSRCRDVLIPGFETATAEICETALSGGAPKTEQFQTYYVNSGPFCSNKGQVSTFVEQLPGVFAHEGIISDAKTDNYGDVANLGFVLGEQSIAVIDAGGSRKVAEEMYRAIRQVSDLPISHVILTHMHPDHVLGAAFFADLGAKVVGQAGLERALADRGETYLMNFGRLMGEDQFIGTRVVTPDIEVESTLEIDLGARALELTAWPQSHTSTDLTVMDVTTRILFTGDLVFDGHAPALDGSLRGWQEAFIALKAIDARAIIPGHGRLMLDWPEAAAPMERYLGRLAEDTREAIDAGSTLGEAIETVAQDEAENWQLFELFNPRNATVAYTELEWE